MPTLPLHPAIVHLPLGIALLVPLVAAVAAVGLWWGWQARRLLGVVVGLQAAVVIGGHLAGRMGARDAHQVETALGPRAVALHEERAETFLLAATALLLAAAAGLACPVRLRAPVAAVVAAGSLGVAALALRAGQAGGDLSQRYRAALSSHGADGAPHAARLAGLGSPRD
jgi:hypothetical protein